MMASLEFSRMDASGMEIHCTFCGKRDGEPGGWRMVIELDKPGTDIRNTLFILDRWDESKALDPHAVSFCSSECEGRYLAVRHRQLVA